MSEGVVGTMSTLGFIDADPNLAMERHFTYWLVSRRDQCKIIPNVPSFMWILMQYNGNMSKVETEVKSALNTYFMELFGTVVVQTATTQLVDGASEFTLQIAVQGTRNGKTYDLQKAVIVSGTDYTLTQTA